jgi:hypothetical protein
MKSRYDFVGRTLGQGRNVVLRLMMAAAQQRVKDRGSFSLPIMAIRRKDALSTKVEKVIVRWRFGRGVLQNGRGGDAVCDVDDGRGHSVHGPVQPVRTIQSLHSR